MMNLLFRNPCLAVAAKSYIDFLAVNLVIIYSERRTNYSELYYLPRVP
jgi:hypothetical protein